MATKLNPGEFDCLKNALPDEPYFMLLARDLIAPETVRTWGRLRYARGLNRLSDKQIVEANQCADAMEQWNVTNWPHRRAESLVQAEARDVEVEIIKELAQLYAPNEVLAWLIAPHPLFGGLTPFAMIAAGRGAEVVQYLQQILEGAYS